LGTVPPVPGAAISRVRVGVRTRVRIRALAYPKMADLNHKFEQI